MERETGIEPASLAWKAKVLPLNYSRSASEGAGGGGWIRTSVGVNRQIYSLLPLTTRPPLREGRKRTIMPETQRRGKRQPHFRVAACASVQQMRCARLLARHFTPPPPHGSAAILLENYASSPAYLAGNHTIPMQFEPPGVNPRLNLRFTPGSVSTAQRCAIPKQFMPHHRLMKPAATQYPSKHTAAKGGAPLVGALAACAAGAGWHKASPYNISISPRRAAAPSARPCAAPRRFAGRRAAAGGGGRRCRRR